MATTSYMNARKKWYRPQGMLWSDTPGTFVNNRYIPSGYEVLSDQSTLSLSQIQNSFIILSDHNRSPISVSPQRLEQKTRMINGTMRSYHIADKLSLSVSWSMLPSRSHAGRPNFDQVTGVGDFERTARSTTLAENEYTVDGGAGGAEMLKWYEDHTGPFWVFLSYDKYTNFGSDNAAYGNLNEYSEILQMYISDFNYSIIKRGQQNFDMWDVSVTLEEV
jgi:hypothetical protein